MDTGWRNFQFNIFLQRIFYEIGIGLKWVFLSRSFYERVNQRKYQLEENKIDFEISKQQLKTKWLNWKKEIAINYKNIERAKKPISTKRQLLENCKGLLIRDEWIFFKSLKQNENSENQKLRKKQL